jgi:ribonucleotide monophosphatase NagD (HAD superfamily)
VKKSILVRTGYGPKTEVESAAALRDAVVVDDLNAAVEWILDPANR